MNKSWRLIFPVLLPFLTMTLFATILPAETFVFGRRLDDACAEHDTLLGYAMHKAPAQSTVPVWRGAYAYNIIATHPMTITDVNGRSPSAANWCQPIWDACTESGTILPEITATAVTSGTIYDDGTWVVKLNTIPEMPLMTVSMTTTEYATNAIIINRRYSATGDSWPEVFVLYANGFLRTKPLAVTLQQAIDGLPCYGTSAVLGPYQYTPPLLDNAPHPELHPVMDDVNILLSSPDEMPTFAMAGRFLDKKGAAQMFVNWQMEMTEVSSERSQLDVRQQVRLATTATLPKLLDDSVLGIAALSSMWADADTHDSDTLLVWKNGSVVGTFPAQVITGTDYGETPPINSNIPFTMSLVTTTATDHNVGSPDLHIFVKQADLYFPIFIPLVMK